jgi:hypothetical protein
MGFKSCVPDAVQRTSRCSAEPGRTLCKYRDGPRLSSAHAARRRAAQRPGHETDGYAMNIRAAEAIVSNAPKAMKILPISEV